jgi:hypothetical protein
MNIIRINYASVDGRFAIAVRLVQGFLAGKTYPFHQETGNIEDILCFGEDKCLRPHEYCILRHFDDLDSMLTWKDVLVFTLRKKQKEWNEQNPLAGSREERVAYLPSSEDFVISE